MDLSRTPVDPVIFLEKVRRPVVRGLARERLESRLAALRGDDPACCCVLVLAPPGAGKTTLLAQLVEGAGLPAAWYRAGPEDGDEISLTRHLGYALGSALADPSVITAAGEGRIEALLRVLNRPDLGQVRLVVDDLHELAGTPAEAALETFLRLRPRTITVALGSRRQPGLNTSRLLVSGELLLIDVEDLRFRSWEVEELFRSVYAAPLSPEAAAALTRRTGGWAAGLQLFHLATAHLDRVERERAISDLSGRSRLIRSYLARNVLDGLAPDRRHFLLHTTALGVLTGDLCDALLQTQDSAAVLAELEREQFFTTSSDGGVTYHYHQVLQTYLEVLLIDELGGRGARDLYARSARLLEQAGRTAEAVRAHARAEDWGAVARLMRPGAVVVGGDDALWRSLTLPGAPTDDPGLVLAGARRAARDGRLEEALQDYREAERLLDDPTFGRRCAAERQAVAVWLPMSAGAALPPVPAGHEPEAALLRRSVALRELTRDLRRPATQPDGWPRALGLLLAGDLEGAADELVPLSPAGPADPRDAEASWEPLAGQLVGCLLDSCRDPDDDLAGRLETLALSADLEGWPWLARLGRSLLTAVRLLHPGGPAQVAAARDLLGTLARGPDRWSALVAAVCVGAAALRTGEPELVALARRQAGRLAAGLGAPTLVGALDALTTGVGSASGRPSTAAAAARPSAPGTAGARLRCLGGFSLTVDGREAGWRELRPKARMLLMRLALDLGRPLHRELIIADLWPEATLSSGIRSLQVAVSSVRQCLTAAGVPGDPVRRTDDSYALVLGEATSDLAEFERLADRGHRQPATVALRSGTEALACYRGDLLPEVGPADWVVEERDRLRLRAAMVATASAAVAVELGEHSVALDLSRRSVALDPHHDPAWRLLIDCYERLGDLSAAAVARAEHQRIWDELGLSVPAGR